MIILTYRKEFTFQIIATVKKISTKISSDDYSHSDAMSWNNTTVLCRGVFTTALNISYATMTWKRKLKENYTFFCYEHFIVSCCVTNVYQWFRAGFKREESYIIQARGHRILYIVRIHDRRSVSFCTLWNSIVRANLQLVFSFQFFTYHTYVDR